MRTASEESGAAEVSLCGVLFRREKLRDIKKKPLNTNELKSFKNITGTFRSLLNNRAQKLKNIDKKTLSEEKIFSLLKEHYTYLKRPILHFNGQLLIGNSKKNIEAIKNIF